MPKKSFTVGADLSEALGLTGTVVGMFEGMKTNLFASSIIELSHAEMAQEFDANTDLIYLSGAGSKALAHVYDWGRPQDGETLRRLWRHTLMGQGRNQTAGFEWMASIRAIPTPLERHDDLTDPMSGVPLEELQPSDDEPRLSNRRYIFTWKAPIMEYNLPVTISPKFAKALFIPTWNAPNGKGFIITAHAQHFNPGGPKTTNTFTDLWVDWWTNQAPRVFDEKIAKIVERDLAKIPFAGAKYAKRSTNQFGSLAVSTAAANQARDIAEEYVKGRANGYRRIANAARAGELIDE